MHFLNSITIIAITSTLLLVACQATTEIFTPSDAAGTASISSKDRTQGKSTLASFLVGQQAVKDNDIARAAEEFAVTLTDRTHDSRLMQLAFLAFYVSGDIENAALLAGQLEQRGEYVTFGSEPSLILAIEAHDYTGMAVIADHIAADEVTSPLGIIVGSWALIFQGRGDAGLTRILELKSKGSEQNTSFVVFSQIALMNEYLGRPDDAMAAALMAVDHPDANIAVIINMAGVLARLGAHDKAYDILDAHLSQTFYRKGILADLKAGTSPLLSPPDIDNLLAEAILEVSIIIREGHILRSGRLLMASRLAPNNNRINYAVGLYYHDLDQFDNAQQYYDRISEDSLWHQPSLFIKARYLSRDEQNQQAAKKIFEDLTQINPDSDRLWQYAANAAHRRGDREFALSAYEKAITLNPDKAWLHYTKAVVLDQLGRKDEAEIALRHSLKLNPDDANVLNYLGYWLLEEGGDANEALDFIRKAIEKEPQNGYFIDSLGWGYFRLGRYRQAILYLERAASLEPQNPVITDHLGDAYAFTNRTREARYQWERALKFSPDDDLKAQILEKLENGIQK